MSIQPRSASTASGVGTTSGRRRARNAVIAGSRPSAGELALKNTGPRSVCTRRTVDHGRSWTASIGPVRPRAGRQTARRSRRRRPRAVNAGGARSPRPASDGPTPATRPSGSCSWRPARARLEAVLDREAVGAEQPDPLAVRQLEGHVLPIVDRVQPEVVDDQAVADLVGVERPADRRDRRLVAEREQPARSQQAGGLGDGPVGVGKGHRPEVAEHDVERGVGERHRLRARVDEWDVDAGFRHQCAGRVPVGARRCPVQPGERRVVPARSTTGPRRSRAPGCPGRQHLRGPAAPPRGSGRSPTQARRCPRAGRRAATGTRRCTRSTRPGSGKRVQSVRQVWHVPRSSAKCMESPSHLLPKAGARQGAVPAGSAWPWQSSRRTAAILFDVDLRASLLHAGAPPATMVR